MERILTTTETAKRLGVTPQAITSWIRQGQFPNAYKVNPNARKSPYRIPEDDIIAFEEKRQRKPGQDQD